MSHKCHVVTFALGRLTILAYIQGVVVPTGRAKLYWERPAVREYKDNALNYLDQLR